VVAVGGGGPAGGHHPRGQGGRVPGDGRQPNWERPERVAADLDTFMHAPGVADSPSHDPLRGGTDRRIIERPFTSTKDRARGPLSVKPPRRQTTSSGCLSLSPWPIVGFQDDRGSSLARAAPRTCSGREGSALWSVVTLCAGWAEDRNHPHGVTTAHPDLRTLEPDRLPVPMASKEVTRKKAIRSRDGSDWQGERRRLNPKADMPRGSMRAT
jgi:hypothetical protein